MQISLSSFVRNGLFGLTAIALSVGIGACGDDPVAAPPPGSSKIIMMHANPGLTAASIIFKNDVTTLASLDYGLFATSVLGNGNRNVKVRALDGTELGSVDFSLDSSTSQMAIFAGSVGAKEVIKVNTPKITVTGGNAAVRIVHASSNAGDVIVLLNSANGTPFTATNLVYKGSTTYKSLSVSSTDSLIVFKSDGVTRLLSIPTKTPLAALKTYTIILYGSTDPTAAPAVQLAAKVIQED